MNTEYTKDYKDKELRQYVLAYLLITVTSVGFHTQLAERITLSSLLKMATIDVFVGAICVLVFVFNELWSDKAKTIIVYGKMPSDTVFSDISNGKIDATGFDFDKAKNMYAHLFTAPANKQTAEWGLLLRKSRDAGRGNVIEAERLQLMTRDMCVSTVSLLIMSLIAFVVLIFVEDGIRLPFNIFGLPIAYLAFMFLITRAAAKKRAVRFVAMVIKNDVQSSNDVSYASEGEYAVTRRTMPR